MTAMHSFTVGPYEVGPDAPLLLLGGPCVIESAGHAVDLAGNIHAACRDVGFGYVFKASFDKANRTSLTSERGPGLDDGLAVLEAVRRDVGVPVVTDVHETAQVDAVAAVVDIIQIPAFLCRQTDLLVAAARSGCAVNVKKGQFLSPQEMAHVVAKVEEAGGTRLLLTERGSSFGYNTLVVDMRSLPIMRGFGWPVVFDATHSVQAPGAAGGTSGGNRDHVPYLARAAAAAGCEGMFFEIHEDPDRAPSDGPNMVRLDDLRPLLESIASLRSAVPPLPPL